MEIQDKKLKSKLKEINNQTPDIVKNRIDDTLSSLPERPSIKRKLKYPVLAASVACALLLGTSAVSPTFSNAMKSLPFVGTVFELVGDLGLRNTSDQGLTQQVNVTAIDQDVAITITEVLYDGAEISIGYILDSVEPLHLGRIDLKANRKSMYNGGSERGELVNEGHYAGVRKFPMRENIPDQFNLTVHIKSLNGIVDGEWQEIQGNWEFKIPVTKLTQDVISIDFTENNSKTYGDQTFIVKKATFSPAVTAIYFDLIQPINDTYNPDSEIVVHHDFQVIDDLGMVIENTGLNMSGNFNMKENIVTHEGQIQLAPTYRIPEFITIRPIMESHRLDRAEGSGKVEKAKEADPITITTLSNEFPIKMNQGTAGDLIINEVSYLEDSVVVQYEVKGVNPFRQARSLLIVDESGRRYDRDPFELTHTSQENYSFSATYPIPKDKQMNLNLYTFEVEAPNFVENLTLTIPIK